MTGFPEIGAPADRVHYLYACFASDGTPLYVGRSSEPENRLVQHNHLSTSWWMYAYCTRAVISEPMSMADAVAREVREIGRLRPVYNRTHNPRPRRWKPVSKSLLGEHPRIVWAQPLVELAS